MTDLTVAHALFAFKSRWTIRTGAVFSTYLIRHIELTSDQARWRMNVAEACRRYGISSKMIWGVSRDRVTAMARQEIWWRARHDSFYRTSLSLPVIGRLSRRDHTTVLHGIGAHAARRATEAAHA